MLTKHCPICGDEFLAKCELNSRQTCSRKCNIEFTRLKQRESARASTRTCKWCGKEFKPESANQQYCKYTHYYKCDVCGKEFVVLDVTRKDFARTCSDECRYIKMTQNIDYSAVAQNVAKTMTDRYGVKNAMDMPGAADKIKATNRSKYDTDYYTQTDEYKQRAAQTCREKYGVDHHLKSAEVIEKREQTNLEKYGFTNAAQSAEVKDKIRHTFMDKYGSANYSQTDEYLSKVMTDATKLDVWKCFRENPAEWLSNNSGYTLCELAEKLGVNEFTVAGTVNKLNLQQYMKKSHSTLEDEVYSYLSSSAPGLVIERDVRRFWQGNSEIDIYLPELNIGIECNPTFTHNSTQGDCWGGPPKSSTYHKSKTILCEAQGIRLIHLFGYEWTNKQEIMKSIMLSVIGQTPNKIFARKCIVREVSSTESMKFLNENHRQGSATSSIRLGLYYNNELVSLITFGKPRHTIGKSHSGSYELIRFCNKLNTSVVGGASKLFSYFKENYNIETVYSFSDRARTSGNLYKVLGFTLDHTSDPGYVWVNLDTDAYVNRVAAQKQNIQKTLNDYTIDLTQSESQIMEAHNYVKVYDSGQCYWIWNRY